MVARARGPVAPYVEFCWLNGDYQLTMLPMIPAAQAFVSRYDDEVVEVIEDDNYVQTLETEQEEEEWEEEEGEEGEEEDTIQEIVMLN